MKDDDILGEERQRLFAMVRERPAKEVATVSSLSQIGG